MAREARLWTWLSNGLKGLGGLHMRRVENIAEDGGPDVDGCYMGRYFELELKGCDRPARGGPLDLKVRLSQGLWHRRRWSCGGNVWLYVRVGSGRDVKRYLLPGKLTRQISLLDVMPTEEELLHLSVLPPNHHQRELLDRACSREGITP